MRGTLVCVCGPDASGKTTLINEFVNDYPGWTVFKFPNRDTPNGHKIHKILTGELKVSKAVELKLFADNRAEQRSAIIDCLMAGTNVILDRYAYCSLAYTMTKQYQEVFQISTKCNTLLSEDLTFKNVLHFDRDNLKPDFAIIVEGDYLHTRSDKEIYDRLPREILYNNYIVSMLNTKTNFCVIKSGRDASFIMKKKIMSYGIPISQKIETFGNQRQKRRFC
jgi:thymidylate kinase